MSTFNQLLPNSSLRVYKTHTASGQTNIVNSLSNILANSMIVTTSQNEDLNRTFSVASNPSLTWVSRVVANAATAPGEIWTANVPTAINSLIISGTWSAPWWGTQTSYAITSVHSIGVGSNGTNATSSLSIASTKQGSLLIGLWSDWNATAGGSRLQDPNADLVFDRLLPGLTRGIHWYRPQTPLGRFNEGVSSPTSANRTTSVLEIRET